MKTSRIHVALACAIGMGLAASPALAAATLTHDGVKLSFELARSGRGGSLDRLDEGVLSLPTVQGGVRLVVDRRDHRYFGYLVKTALAGRRRFTLEVGPLTPEARAEVERRMHMDLVGDPLTIDYPPPSEVAEDEPLLLDLMVNPTTGEKLYDIIRVGRETRDRDEAIPPLNMVRSSLRINGRLMAEGGVSSQYISFYERGYGRFVISLEPVPGYDFAPAELVANLAVRFTHGGNRYEWTSQEPIVRREPVPDQLWVWYDSSYKPKDGTVSGFSGGLVLR
jgi:hypothetical protein